MTHLPLRILALAAALLVAPASGLRAQFDTEPIKSTEYADCGDSLSLYSLLSSPTIPITRSLDRFRLGLNWYGMDGFSQLFGVSLIDNYVYANGDATKLAMQK